jgi:hypothetical protein
MEFSTTCGLISRRKIAIFKQLLRIRILQLAVLVFASVFFSQSWVLAQSKDPLRTYAEAFPVRVTELDLPGNPRTTEQWLRQFLGLTLPTTLQSHDVERLRQKLMTTDVFLEVYLTFERIEQEQESAVADYKMQVHLIEKWTTIPVVRGAFGGGTPLAVLGVYDTHAFGSLWTLGAEGRKYGDAPWGGVIWARAPRWGRGKHFLSFEWWRLNRIRSLYDQNFAEMGSVFSDIETFRMTLLHPMRDAVDFFDQPNHWQLGVDLLFQRNRGFAISLDHGYEANPQEFGVGEAASEVWILPTLLYDSIEIDGLQQSGLKLQLQFGGVLAEGKDFSTRGEVDLFHYLQLSNTVQIATHGRIATTQSDSLMSQYFLGGLESIRGIPDGAIYGNHAWYLNIEPRWVVAHQKYAWWQLAAFVDAGAAARNFNQLRDSSIATAGAGVRLSIPQIYRLILRLDYAWVIGDPRIQSINIGLNQFFQPHKPL